MQEIWKDIKNFEGRYQVSNKGRVKSLAREIFFNDADTYTRHSRKSKERILKSKSGRFSLCKGNGIYITYYIKPLMLKYFPNSFFEDEK